MSAVVALAAVLLGSMFQPGAVRTPVSPPRVLARAMTQQASQEASQSEAGVLKLPRALQTGGASPAAAGQPPSADMTPITLQVALEQARANSPLFRSALSVAQLAAEDRVQARAALFPLVTGTTQFIYTRPNGTLSGIFIANNGPREYIMWGQAHGDVYAPGKWADYRRTQAAEASAQARADLAARGLVAIVVQAYYGVAAAQHKAANAQQSLREAQQFLTITEQQERGGEVAHSDVVKAQIQVAQRQREAQDADLAFEKSRVGLAVLVFPEYRENFTVVDDLQDMPPLRSLAEVRSAATQASPDVRAAQALLTEESFAVSVARAGFLPTVSFDYWYGIDAADFAVNSRDEFGVFRNNLGSSAQALLTVPLWNWGSTQSKLRQAELRVRQARADLSLVQRQLFASISTFYHEAETAYSQVGSLRDSLSLATESLRLTLLRYQAGEVTVLEVVDAQTTLIQARNAYDDGLVRYRVALAALQTLTGTL